MSKTTSATEAASAIADGAAIAITGSGGGLLEADAVMAAIEARFLATGHPRGLTLVHALGVGDGTGSGVGRFAHEGLVSRVIGGHWAWAPAMQALARENLIEAYVLPAGVLSTLFREIGAGRPGVITEVGLGTFVDPDHGGGKANARAKDDLVERVMFDGRPYLRYKPFPVDIGIIRASHADSRGNLSLQREPADLDAYAVALAAHNSNGHVIAQVGALSDAPILPARLASIPGVLVDHIVVHDEQWQTQAGAHDPALSGEVARSDGSEGAVPEGVRRIIAGRAARELRPGASVNFGFGMPAAIPALVSAEEKAALWGTIEQGGHNGDLIDGPLFGASRYPQAIVSSLDQFDFYSGGGVDIAFLGMGEMDADGNVNVSRLGDSVVGPGGFMDITRKARKVVFCGTFEAKGLRVEQTGNSITITNPGSLPKLVQKVREVTFSGAEARRAGQEVLYVTERAVFKLGETGVMLIEVADGIDRRRDILDRMGFRPEMP